MTDSEPFSANIDERTETTKRGLSLMVSILSELKPWGVTEAHLVALRKLAGGAELAFREWKAYDDRRSALLARQQELIERLSESLNRGN